MEGLSSLGFKGFVPVGELTIDHGRIDRGEGVYLILRVAKEPPQFLEVGTGGHFHDKDPNVPIQVLREKWVEGTIILYIGKASRSLRRRLGKYLDFGEGEPVAHWGGRYIWQLKDSSDLLVCWKELDEDTREVEARMILEFERQYGKLPFANLVH